MNLYGCQVGSSSPIYLCRDNSLQFHTDLGRPTHHLLQQDYIQSKTSAIYNFTGHLNVLIDILEAYAHLLIILLVLVAAFTRAG